MPTCSKCGEQVFKDIEILGTKRRVPVVCKCKKEELRKKAEKDVYQQRQDRLKSLFKNSLMDSKFYNETFEKWDKSKCQQQMFNIAFKYCRKFKEAKENGLGLIVYGSPGNGKTYMVNSIANDLLKRGYPVICVSINSLLDRLKETYKKWGEEGEGQILKSLSNADLLIIDDLGTEQESNWSVSRVYNIIDSRYRNGLPLIITTNYTMEALKDKYSYRTVDRILEMCTPIENKGPSIRRARGKAKTDLLKEILK